MAYKIDAWAHRQLTECQSKKLGSIFRNEGLHIPINLAYAIQDTMVKLRPQKVAAIAGYNVGYPNFSITNFSACGGQFAGVCSTKKFIKTHHAEAQSI